MPLPDYQQLEAALRQAGAMGSAAESHGTLCGLLTASDAAARDKWIQVTFESSGLPADVRPEIDDVYVGARGALASMDMEFEPLLPPDERSASERTEALGQWCQGFLYGLSLAGFKSWRELPGDAREILSDLSEIAKVDPASAGDDDAALMEVVEYVRVGVQTVYEAFHAPPPTAPTSETQH